MKDPLEKYKKSVRPGPTAVLRYPNGKTVKLKTQIVSYEIPAYYYVEKPKHTPCRKATARKRR